MTTTPQRTPEDQAEAITAAHVQRWLDEAHELRAYGRPPLSAGPEVVHEALVEVGGRLDRMEGILEEITGYLGGLQTAAWRREEEAQDAFDEQIRKLQARAVRREFEGAQERYSLARLESREERHAARLAKLVCDPVATCEKRVRLMFWGLKALSDQLSESLRYQTWVRVTEGT